MKLYAQEFGRNWSNLLGAALGVSMGISLYQYTANVFGPSLIKEFGWSRSEFALLGAFSFINMFFYPIIGRFTDRFGARTTATVGFVFVPASLVALSFMTGNIFVFYAIITMKSIFGIMTSSLVFSRIVVERFHLGRGLALSLVMSAPPLVASGSVLIAGYLIDTEGWRQAYRILAIACAVAGVVAIALIGRSKRPERPAVKASARATLHEMFFSKEVRALLRQPVFLAMIAGMCLVNIPQNLVSSQLSLVLEDIGVEFGYATWLISLYPVSVLVGRFLTGLALDKVSPHVVALVFLGTPAISLMLLAGSVTAEAALITAVLFIGLAQGAEGDIGAFLTSRKFDIQDYGLIYSLLIASMSLANALGSVLLSLTLVMSGSYALFLVIGAAATILGALLFFLTGHYPDFGGSGASPEPVSAAAS